jgi:hypothetical protein
LIYIKGGLGAISSSRCQTAHACQANPAGRESLSLLDEPARCKRAVLRKRSNFAGGREFAPEPEQKKPVQPGTAADHRIATTDLVEPDGIEPTTSCLQSRRSPN